MKKPWSLRETCFILAVLSILIAIFFYDVFFLGKTFKVTTANAQAVSYGVYGQKNNRPAFIPINGTDGSVLEEPNLEFVKVNLQKGILPLWNPHQALGFPFIGMLEVGIFFPLNILFYLLPQLYAWDVLILTRFLFGGLFVFWFMRSLRFTKIPSLVAALTYIFSGPMVLLQYWFVNVEIIAPLFLLSLEYLIRKTSLKHIFFVAASFALLFFGGHPEHIFFVNVVGFLFFCFRVFSIQPKADLKKSFGALLCSYALGLGLSMVVLLPFLHNLFFEFWSTHPPEVGLSTGELKERFISIALPHFFQKEPLTYDFTFSGWWGGYMGTLPLALAFYSLLRKQRRGLNYFFAALAFIIITKAYSFPFFNWIGSLPIFNICRFYIHTPHLFALLIAILAAMGTRAILLEKKSFLKGLIFFALMIIATGIHLFVFRKAAHFDLSLRATFYLLGLLVALQGILWIKDKKIFPVRFTALALVVLLGFELFSYIHRERPKRFDSYPKVPYIEMLKATRDRERSYGVFWSFYPNTASAYQVDDLGIYFSLLPKRYVAFVNALLIKDFFKNSLRPPALRVVPIMDGKPYLDLLSLKFIVAPFTLTPNKPIFSQTLGKENKDNRLIYSKEVSIYQRPDAFPRVFIVHRAVFEPETDAVFDAIKKVSTQLREWVVLNERPDSDIEKQLAQTPLQDASEARITRYSPNEVVIEAYMENPGFLILSDAYHPDWKALVDNRPSKVYAADYLIRAVFLQSGPHKVRFLFKPASFYLGAWVSAATFLFMLILWGGSRRSFRK